jgi:amino acid adenylation domain-containing protein
MTPLSVAQQGLWVNEKVGDVGAIYAMPFTLTFDGPLDVPGLVAAVSAVVERHPVLASAVAERDGVPYLVPVPPPTVEVVEDADLDALVRKPFDLATGPLSRFTLVTRAPDRYVLLVVAHHLVFDGYSTDVFVRDLATAYGSRSRLPALPGSPPSRPSDGAGEYWRDWWREPPVPVLPGRVGPVRPVAAGATVEFAVPGPVRDALTEAAQALGVTRFELLLASWHALLLRYGSEEPTVAVDLGTRTDAERNRIGLYVNELPVTGRPAPTATFAGYVRQLRGELRELYRHRDVPLARAVPGLRPTVALAPVTLTYRRRIAVPEFPGVRTEVDWVRFNGYARGALRVHLVDGPDALDVMLQYAPQTLAPQAVQRLAGHWTTLLGAALSTVDTPLTELPVLTAPETVEQGTTVEYPPVTVLDLVAAAPPDRVAVAGALTYGELDAAANRVAYRLRANRIGRGDVVGVCLERGPDLVAALLGVLRSGAAYLPLDPTHPAQRHKEILADADAVLLPEEIGDPEPASLPEVGPDDRAYVIYTSGSTGQPKGVAIGHRALANLLLAMRDELEATQDTRFLALTSISFDISALELFLPLTVGGAVVVATADEVRDGAALCGLVKRHGVTHVQATPSGWRLLCDAGCVAPSVVALAGGEALPLALAREVRARVGRLVNVYGPTETTIWSTIWPVPADPTEVCIGRPIANTVAYVLDARGEPVPIGVPGELYLGGAGLALGYVSGDAQRFPTIRGERLYRTGDLVRYGEDGLLRYLHRIDDQVKLRGYRIEPAEIEARLLEYPTVSAAAVAVRDEQLVAYVVAENVDGLREHVAALLPEYMAPARYVVLDRLPLTPNGKLDRRALPDPADKRRLAGPAQVLAHEIPAPRQPSTVDSPPVDPLTAEVAAICAEVLQRDTVGLEENLFDLGAHSLTLTAIASRIRSRLGADLPLHVFFDDPTVAVLAAAAAQLVGAATSQRSASAQPVGAATSQRSAVSAVR